MPEVSAANLQMTIEVMNNLQSNLNSDFAMLAILQINLKSI